MPDIEINGRSIHYLDTGEGSETVFFSHGYMMNHRMYQDQIDLLKSRYRVIAFDHRGHGESDHCRDAFAMSDLVDDAEQLVDRLVGGPVHFVGMSTGGFVAIRLLLKRPDLINKLVLIDTSANAEQPEHLSSYRLLLFLVLIVGVRPLLGKSLAMLFSEKFRKDPSKAERYNYWKQYMAQLDRRSLRSFGNAIFGRTDVLGELRSLSKHPKTLILVGEKDLPTPPDRARAMQDAIPGSELVLVPDSGHTSPVENPEVVNQAISSFLEK